MPRILPFCLSSALLLILSHSNIVYRISLAIIRPSRPFIRLNEEIRDEEKIIGDSCQNMYFCLRNGVYWLGLFFFSRAQFNMSLRCYIAENKGARNYVNSERQLRNGRNYTCVLSALPRGGTLFMLIAFFSAIDAMNRKISHANRIGPVPLETTRPTNSS